MKESIPKVSISHNENSVFPHLFNPEDYNPNRHPNREDGSYAYKSHFHDTNSIPKHTNRKPKQLQQRHN